MPRPRRTPTVAAQSVDTFGNRKFGVELELYGLNQAEATAVLNAAGITCYNESYNHQTRTWWKAVSDASIVDHNGRSHYDNAKTCEIVSPILSGTDGLETVRKVCRALTAAGGKVNKSTGLHVHIDARGFSPRVLATLAFRYAKHETVIDSFMPASRRANENNFCQSMIRNANYYRNDIITASDANAFARAFPRQSKLNFHAYLRHGTVEFRHHSGSLNAEKVSNWIKFCHAFVQTSINMSTVAIPSVNNRGNVVAVPRNTAERRLAKFFFDRGCSDYATVSDIASAIHVAESTVPALMSKLRRLAPGFNAKKNRYWGYWIRDISTSMTALQTYLGTSNNNAVRANNVEIPVMDTCFAGLDAETTSYYNERIADFQGA